MNDLTNKKFDNIKGFVKLGDNYIQFEYNNGVVTFVFRELNNIYTCDIDFGYSVEGYCFGDNNYVKVLFYTSEKMIIKKDFLTNNIGITKFSFPIIYYIYDYKKDTEYSSMYFIFPELAVFAPSHKTFDNKLLREGLISISSENMHNFVYISYQKEVHFDITQSWQISHDMIHSECNSVCKLCLSFESTNDLEFINKIFNDVKNLFSFIFNRINISLFSAKLLSSSVESIENDSGYFIPVPINRTI